MIPGEGEILGQVRSAHEAGATGPLLDRLFRQALQAGQKARSQTAIGESPASVSSAAAALAEQVFGDLKGRTVLVVGAGKVGESAIRNLVSRGATIASVANRTGRRAEELTQRFGGEALPLDRVEDELAARMSCCHRRALRVGFSRANRSSVCCPLARDARSS